MISMKRLFNLGYKMQYIVYYYRFTVSIAMYIVDNIKTKNTLQTPPKYSILGDSAHR